MLPGSICAEFVLKVSFKKDSAFTSNGIRKFVGRKIFTENREVFNGVPGGDSLFRFRQSKIKERRKTSL